MGIARIVCAITMAVGVKSNARKPSGPECERARYKTRPTTTGGKPKNALIKTMTNRRPRNGKIARAVPIGKLMAVATAVAAKLTLIDSPTISRKSRNLSGPSFKQSGWRAAPFEEGRFSGLVNLAVRGKATADKLRRLPSKPHLTASMWLCPRGAADRPSLNRFLAPLFR